MRVVFCGLRSFHVRIIEKFFQTCVGSGFSHSEVFFILGMCLVWEFRDRR